jgi:hypothetical protein
MIMAQFSEVGQKFYANFLVQYFIGYDKNQFDYREFP